MATPGDAGVVEIGDVDSHAGARFAFAAEGDSGLDGGIFEGAVALVAVKLVGLSVVGDEQIGPAVAVLVEQGDAERFRTAVEDSAGGGDIFERAVAAIVKQPAGCSAIRFGRAVGLVFAVEAAEDVGFGRPLHVVADEQIEQAVAIVVEPQRGGAEALALAEAGGVGDVDERALAGVAEESVLADAGDEDVGKAVVVVVADGHAHAVEFDIETGAGGYVGEGAVAVVAVEPKRGAGFLVSGPVGTIDQKNVLPAVAIVVEKGAAGAESFGQELSAEGSAVVLEVDAGRIGDVGEAKSESIARPLIARRRIAAAKAATTMQSRHSSQERPAIHGTFTSPARIA